MIIDAVYNSIHAYSYGTSLIFLMISRCFFEKIFVDEAVEGSLRDHRRRHPRVVVPLAAGQI